MKNKVGVAKCPRYEYPLIKKTLDTIVEATNFPDCRGKYVLVKPNVLSDAPKEKNITTNPLVVKAVIEILKEKGAGRIICGDSRDFRSLVQGKGVRHCRRLRGGRRGMGGLPLIPRRAHTAIRN